MAHHHHHEPGADDTYYLDQLCMVGMAALFGGICLALFFWNRAMLTLLLGPQFHDFILASGVILILLALIRGTLLWIQVGKAGAPGHEHTHDHGHENCGHDHGHDEPHMHALHVHEPGDHHHH